MKTFGSSTNLVIILREIPDTKAADKSKNRQIVEIWRDGYLHNSLDLGQLDKHGKVYTDGELNISASFYSIHLLIVEFFYTGTFGCFELSPDEKHLVYLAEKKEPKKQSYLQFGITPTPEGAKVVFYYTKPILDFNFFIFKPYFLFL